MFDTFKLLGKLSEMKNKMQIVRGKLSSIEVEEWSNDRLVRVTATADKKIKSIEISENILYPSAKTDLENKLTMTINTALEKAETESKKEVKKEFEGILPDIPGLDLNDLPL